VKSDFFFPFCFVSCCVHGSRFPTKGAARPFDSLWPKTSAAENVHDSGDCAAEAAAKAVMMRAKPLVVAGLPVAEKPSFAELSPALQITAHSRGRDQVKAGQSLLQVSGPAQAILTGERVALNFVQRLSGIATLTRQFVDAVRGTRAQVLDTRKTTPGLRRLEKYAVTCGGGHNHRFGLFDHVLIKDNHLAALRDESPTCQRVRRDFDLCCGNFSRATSTRRDGVRRFVAQRGEVIVLIST